MNPANSLFKNIVFTHFVKVALLPSLLLLGTKVVSMAALIFVYNIQYSVKDNSILFSDINGFILANDYSSAIAFLFVFSFTLWLVFKGYFFHKTHVSPWLSAWLLRQDLSYLVSGSLDLYIRIFIWLIFTWLACGLILLHYVIGFASLWLVTTSVILAFVLTVLVVIDIERDYKLYAREKFLLRAE